MRSRSPALVLLVLALCPSFARAADDDVLVVTPRWKAGDTHRYEKTKSRERTAPNGAPQEITARSTLDLEVVSVGDDGIVLAWIAGDSRFDDPAQAANPLVARLGDVLKNARALLVLDQRARITGVRNWKELQGSFFKMRDAVVEELRSAGPEAAGMADQIGAQVTSMIDTREKVEDLVGRGEAQLFLLPLGVRLSRSEPLVLDGQLPNMLGGEPIPAKAKFEVTKYDEDSEIATIVYTQTVDPKDSKRILEETIRRMGEKMGRQPPPDAKALADMTFDDRAEYVVHVPTGLMQSFSHDRTVKGAMGSQRDTLTIRRATPP